MAVQHEVRCVRKTAAGAPHERITHLGGLNDDYTRWEVTQAEAIRGIETGKWAFYVMRGRTTVDVVVAVDAAGRKYLKTAADGDQPDVLLGLVDCPRTVTRSSTSASGGDAAAAPHRTTFPD